MQPKKRIPNFPAILGGCLVLTAMSLADDPPYAVVPTDGPATQEPGGGIAGAGCSYVVDDGGAEFIWGAIDASCPDPEMCYTFWMNGFETDCEVISAIRVRTLAPGAAPYEREIRVFLYDDPDNDGDPTTGPPVLLASTSATTTGFGFFTDYQITPTEVTGTFFIAAMVRQFDTVNTGNERAAYIDTSNNGGLCGAPETTCLSYFGFDITDIDDPLNPLPNQFGPLGPELPDPFEAVWMLRAIGNPLGLVNDTCDDAQLTALGATAFDNQTGGNDRWFNFVVTCPGDHVIDTCGSDFATEIEVFSGAGCPPGAPIASSLDGCGAPIVLPTTAGDILNIRVSGAGGATGNGVLNLACPIDIPANDVCADAIAIVGPGPGGSVEVVGTNNFAHDDPQVNTDPAEDCGNTFIGGAGVWYTLQGTGNEMTLSTCHPDTNFNNTDLVVFCKTEAGCDFLICVDGNADDTACTQGGPDPTNLSTVSFCSDAKAEYFVYIEGAGGSTGDFTLVVSDDGAPCMPAASCSVENDNCLFPDEIAVGQTINGDLCSAAPGPQPADLCGHSEFTAARWFTIDGDGTTYTASLCGFATEYDTALAVYSGDCANLQCAVQTIPDFPCFPNEEVSWIASYGVTYRIRVFADFACGNFQLSVSSNGVDATPYSCNATKGSPPNDCCDAAEVVVLMENATVAVNYDTTNAQTDNIDPDPSNPCGSAGDDAEIWHGVWYEVVPPVDGTLTVSNCDGNSVPTDEDGAATGIFDSKIAIYDVTDVPVPDRCSESGLHPALVICSEDCTIDATSEAVAEVTAGRTYWARLGGFDSDGDGLDGQTGMGLLNFTLGDGGGGCSGDTNGDNVVDVQDLVNVILDWGTNGAANGGDVNGSGIVDVTDLTTVILAWGACP